jgi:hypothetical protein
MAGLKQQFAVRRCQLALHAGLTHVGRIFTRAIQQLAGGEQRKQGNKD